jgi:hypothetical protein
MKSLLFIAKLILPFYLLFFNASNLSAQWQQYPFFFDGSAITLERVNDELWAGTSLGIHKSFDEGETWEMADFFNNLLISKIQAFDDTVIVFYSVPGVINQPLRSKTSFDGGVTWNAEFAFNQGTGFGDFLRSGNMLYIFGSGYSYLSSDFGLTWQPFITNYDNEKTVVHCDEELIIFRQYINFETVFSKQSLETGVITQINSNGYNLGYDVFHMNNAIYAISEIPSTINFHLIKTIDDGQNWDTLLVLEDYSNTFSEFITFNGATYCVDIFAIEVAKIFNNGDSVELVNKPELINSFEGNSWSYECVELSNGNYLIPGVYSSNDAFYVYDSNLALSGTTGLGINTGSIFRLKQVQNKILVNVVNSLFLSDDELSNWDTLLTNGLIYNSLIKGDTMVFAGSVDFSITYDGGQSWLEIYYPDVLDFQSNYSMAALNNVLYVEGSTHTVKSIDWGSTWEELPDLAFDYNGIFSNTNDIHNGYILQVGNEIFFAANRNALVLKLNTSNNSYEYVYGFNYQGDNQFVNHKLEYSDSILFSFSTGHLMYSENEGVDWVIPSMNGLPVRNEIDTLYPNQILVDTNIWYGSFNEFGVYFSLDQGNNWNPLESPSRFVASGGMALINNVLYTGSSNGGIWTNAVNLNICSGNVFHDMNFNGNRDTGENGISNILVKASSNNALVSTNENGDYQIATALNSDTLTAILPLQFAEIVPENIATIGAQTNNNFAIQLSPFNDLSIGLTALSVFRPGFYTQLQIGAQNLGSSDSPATVKLLLPEDISVITSNPNFTSQSGDTLIWEIPNLEFFENYSIQLNTLSSVTAPLGDTVRCYVEVSPINSDSFPSNNTFTLQDIYVGSYDPNDKQCLQGNSVHIDSLNSNFELQYTIRFQNTGTYEAENVRIEDQLSSNLRWETLRIIDQSHEPMVFEINDGGLLKFYFNNIQLPDSFANEPASHGFVKYGIKVNPTLNLGDVITNTAGIYFDFNEPVITNTVLTEVVDDFNAIKPIENEIKIAEILAIPNPAKNVIRLAFSKSHSQYSTYQIYDAFGRLVFSDALNSLDPTIQIQQLAPGMYFGTVVDNSNLITGKFKFVKQ